MALDSFLEQQLARGEALLLEQRHLVEQRDVDWQTSRRTEWESLGVAVVREMPDVGAYFHKPRILPFDFMVARSEGVPTSYSLMFEPFEHGEIRTPFVLCPTGWMPANGIVRYEVPVWGSGYDWCFYLDRSRWLRTDDFALALAMAAEQSRRFRATDLAHRSSV